MLLLTAVMRSQWYISYYSGSPLVTAKTKGSFSGLSHLYWIFLWNKGRNVCESKNKNKNHQAVRMQAHSLRHVKWHWTTLFLLQKKSACLKCIIVSHVRPEIDVTSSTASIKIILILTPGPYASSWAQPTDYSTDSRPNCWFLGLSAVRKNQFSCHHPNDTFTDCGPKFYLRDGGGGQRGPMLVMDGQTHTDNTSCTCTTKNTIPYQLWYTVK